jgi:hypothetical protein
MYMKNALLFALLLTTLGACQKTEDPEPEAPASPAQTWQLVKFTSSWPRAVKTGADLPYQEKYVFQTDSTFTKTRQQSGQVSVASGTFSVRPRAGKQYTILTYLTYNTAKPWESINTCTSSELEEYLIFTAPDTLLSSSEACDGPRLEYKRLVQ